MIEKKEKKIEAIGRDGKQAILPRESSTQEEESCWSQGRLKTPLKTIQSKNIICKGDPVDPQILLSSVAS